MNIIENVVGYIILSLLLVVSISFIWWIMNLAYITQSRFEATWILEATERELHFNLSSVQVDKDKIGYETEFKEKFITNTFNWLWINLWSNIREGGEFKCYNYYLDWTKININKVIDNNKEIDFQWDYYKTDEDWYTKWTEFINVICLYNTYNYIWANNVIETEKSPLNYVLYSLFKDLRFSKKLVEKKWTLYFN
jgi:hypothetical protein